VQFETFVQDCLCNLEEIKCNCQDNAHYIYNSMITRIMWDLIERATFLIRLVIRPTQFIISSRAEDTKRWMAFS